MSKLVSRNKNILFVSIIAVLSLTMGLWIGCGEQVQSPNQPEVTQERTVLSAENPKVRAVMEVQNRHTGDILTMPGIVGTGTGLTDDGRVAIVVYAESQTLAKGVQLPKKLEDVPVIMKVTGHFKAYADPTARFPRPVPTGVSTGHPDITAGTIGCRVKDGSGNVYALSNNHVYANSNDASLGDNVLQPGPYDGGQDPEDAIGTLFEFEPLKFDGSNNTIDAAIAISTTSDLGNSTPADGYGTPSATTVSASVGLNVKKYGRTTGFTSGQVEEINVTVDVCYETRGPFNCVSLARFVNQISISPGSFSDGGDSGSLIVTDDGNNNAVGLLFAGSETRTLANPIDDVLSRFNVTIDDGSGGTTNSPPTADFTFTTSDLTVDFTDQSTDSDGSIVAWDWDFGDGNTSTAQNPTHTYAASGTYTVSLTVTDDEGATGSTSQDVSVSDGSGGGISLTATGYKVRGLQKADLEWSGTTVDSIDVYRNGALITTTENDGFYTDNIDQRGGASYDYQVCEAGTSTCSNVATVTF